MGKIGVSLQVQKLDGSLMRILVVEDERRLAVILRKVLQEEHYEVDLAHEGDTALTMAVEGSYDLIVLDRMLPGMDGLDICRELRTHGSWVPILMLTARSEVRDRVHGLTAGADDYLTKPFAMTELLARIKALLRRGQATDGLQLKVDDLVLDLPRHEARRAGKLIELTPKEFSLLEFLMRHPGQVLTRAQIIENVWQYDFDALSNVVDTYIHYLRDKVDKGSLRSLIQTVRGIGYRIGA
jgi:two-component system, OmpR family, response regulator